MTTAEQWERLARDANAAAVKAMAEADRLRAELAALRAAGGQEKPTDGYSHPPCCPCPVGMDDRGCSDCLNTGHTHAPDLPMWDDTVDGIRRRHARITAQIDRVWSGEERPDEIADHELAVDHAAKVDVAILLALLPAAAPVGGQAEPSDDLGEAAAHALLGQQVEVVIEREREGKPPVIVSGQLLAFSNDGEILTRQEDGSVWSSWPRLEVRAAAAVSGEQAQPDGETQR